MLWDHHDPFYLFAGTDSGSLCCIDVRSSTPLFTHEAHTSALSGLTLSPSVSGCLVTASNDRSVKVWDVRGHSSAHLVRQRLCKIGEIHCASACPDEPLLFCVGGEFEMKLLNFCIDETVTEKFGVSETAQTDKTVSSTNRRGSDTSPHKPSTVVKSHKSKNTSPDLGSPSPNTASKSDRSNSADHKVAKKHKHSTVEQKPSSSKVKNKKSKNVQNKDVKDTKAQS